MKKIVTFILLGLLLFTVGNVEANTDFNFRISETFLRVYDSSRNTQFAGELTVGGQVSKQRYNILEFDLTGDDNLHLVTISAYEDYKWGMLTLEGMILRYEQANPNVEVLAGINGDFYDINNTGHPTSLFIQDYETLRTMDNNRPILFLREDGSVDIGFTRQNGYEILVIDEFNEIKLRTRIAGFNAPAANDQDINVYTRRFDGTVSEDLNPILIDAAQLRYNNVGHFQSAKGKLSDQELDLEDLDPEDFVVTGSLATDIISETDTVIVQGYHPGTEDVRGSMGGNVELIKDGNHIVTTDNAQHPRTAVGIRADGSVFFFQNNGRDTVEGVKGMRYVEMAAVMASHGAVHAINLDGGGSSTMMARRADGELEVLNQLSDGRMRSVSNGILLVRGDIKERPIEIKGEDTREMFEAPTGLRIDGGNNLRFDEVADATRYLVSIDGRVHETSKPEFYLGNLIPRSYEIKVGVKGNYVGKQSEFSDELTFVLKERTTVEIIEWLREYARNNN
ncbi:MAG TPA: phosphodiester glycosidase family protein [Acholeplasmataceae bacterium]|nr:phosphodiester glycosidase family protein [Acholeplasmataceae bacterium]